MCRVLSVEYSIPYLVKRHVALRRAEIAVESVSSLREAMALLRLGDFDVAVLGHGIPQTERDCLADHLLEKKPNIRIVMMYSGSIRRAEHADAVVSVEGEQHLIPAIKALARNMRVLKKAAGF
jgi:DNA-binding NtrC family response regulator